MNKSQIGMWGVVVLLVAGLIWASQWTGESTGKPDRVSIADNPVPAHERAKVETEKKAKKATLKIDRVVTLDTAKGKIEFVLFEEDCPKSATRVAQLVEAGAYDGLKFGRVENWVIQIDKPDKTVEPMGCEFARGLSNTEGAVGMARTQDPNSNTSIFYILKQPSTFLDYDYTVLGHVIKGLDVVKKMERDDVVHKATIRPSTNADEQMLQKALQAE